MLKRIFEKKGNKGFTFVEIICAVAILSLVSGIIGSVITISTHTYTKGTSDTSVQQTAQLAANNISNIVKDACKVVYGASGEQYIENGTTLMEEKNGSAKMRSEGYTELSLITNENIQYTVMWDEAKSALTYQEYEYDSSTDEWSEKTDSEIMAESIVAFSADTTQFEENSTIELKMTVEDSNTGKKEEMTYTMKSRNGVGEGVEYNSSTNNVVILFLEGDTVLVPGETYQLPISVVGELKDGLDWGDMSSCLTGVSLTTDYAEITVNTDATDATAALTVRTKDKDNAGNYKASATATVYIRRVTGVALSYAVDRSNADGGMQEKAGAVYTFSASVSGNELAKHAGYEYDSDYKIAQSVAWSCVLTVNSTTYNLDYTCTQDENGAWTVDGNVISDAASGGFYDYFSVDTTNSTENAILPKLILTLKQDMTSDFSLTVTATSKHALGYNKAYSQYCTASTAPHKSVTITPRETKVSDAEIILEPYETGSVELDMKGGLTSNVSCVINGATSAKTTATYDADDNAVDITLGGDETGVEGTYTFTVGVYLDGSSTASATITVHVSRIDEMSIEVIDNFTDSSGTTQTIPTYDFRGRINTDTAVYDDMVAATTYLVDESLGTQRSNTLATRITCEMLDEKDKVVYTYQAICIAGIGSNTSTNGSSTTVLEGKAENDYFEVVNIKPARIEYDSNNAPYIKQAPEVDISPSADTDTGIKDNYTLQVTMEMLHPLGTVSSTKYNKTGTAYGTAEATVSISGSMLLEVPEEIIVVEPGQGTDDPTMSDDEMVIPITVNGGGVYSMEVELTGTTDSNTRISNYPKANDSYGNKNPYMASTATSSSQRVWYLGLVIGENEEGTEGLIEYSDGSSEYAYGWIKVTVTAKGTNDKVLCTYNFYLGVRRVDKVTVKEDSGASVSEWNVAGETVTLAAYPTGVDGVEYYAMQTDDDGTTARRWETSDHGAYQTPSTMVWRMYYDGTEKPLSEWTEYFTSISTSTVTGDDDDDVYKGTVTFKLVNKLPSGARIRAYSLHSYGTKKNISSDYKNDSDYTTKYNKSGKEYDGVYGELGLGIIQVNGEWKRGGTVSLYYDLIDEYLTTWSDGTVALDWYPSSIYTWLETHSMYNNSNGNNITDNTGYSFSVGGNSIGGIHSLIEFTGDTTDIRNYTASISTTTSSADNKDWIALSAYSSPYTTSSYYNWWIDLHEISLTSYIGNTWASADGALAVVEETYEIEDVVFQYTNALPNTIAGGGKDGDSDGEWTDKDGDNTLVVYVTKDDTISGYTSYYKLSEGWEETYEAYTLIPSRYVGVISRNTSATVQDGKRFSDFSVTNTTGDGSSNTLGRSYVTFTFSNVASHVSNNDVVQMIYEFNPFFADSSKSYGTSCGITLAQAEAIDGCEGILEFHFVSPNITGSGTLPEVRYCPTFNENEANGATSKTLADGSTVNYYYISDKSRFEIYSDETSPKANYQTTTDAASGSWTTVGSMTYSSSSWTYSAANN